MALALYRRHRRGCKSGHPEEMRTSEYDERKKGWKRCDCPIFVSGTLHKKFARQTTGQWEWEAARAIAAKLEISGQWTINPVPEPPSPVETAERVTVEEAIEAFLAKCQGRDIQPTTFAKYRTFTNQFVAYCARRGHRYIDQVTVTDMDRFYASWNDGVRGKAKKLERLKGFVKFCRKRKWITEDLAEDLEAPTGSSVTVSGSTFVERADQKSRRGTWD